MAHMPQQTDEVIFSHEFSFMEKWLVFLATFITACSFLSVVVVLWKKHKGRGMDIVLVKISALCFLVYRASIAFHLTADRARDYVFLPVDSWHKLANVFMLIEYCSLIIYLARISKELQGYVFALGICIIIVLQEKDSFSYQYALVPLIFNNLVLICSSALYDKPGSFNPSMVLYGAFWYMVSCVGFLLTFSEKLDYYFLFDDLFEVSTAFSMFYSWQSFIVSEEADKPADTMSLKDVPFVLFEMFRESRDAIIAWRNDVRELV